MKAPKAHERTEADEVELEEIDPHRAGWQRHPILPRTWVNDDGKLYVFPLRAREILVRVKGLSDD